MKTTMFRAIAKSVTLSALLVLLAGTASVQASTWMIYNGSYSGNWEDPNHWDSVPVAGSTVVFGFSSATPAVIDLNASTPNLSTFISQGGTGRDLTIDLNGNSLSVNAIGAPQGAYGEVSRLTFVSTGSTGAIDDADSADGLQLQILNAAGVADRPTTSYVTFSTNTQATLWHTTIVQPTLSNTLVGYLTVEDNAQVTVGTTGFFNVAPSGGTAANPVTGTVTIKDTAKLNHTSDKTLTLGSADGYSTGNLTITGGSTDVDLGAINWRNGTFTAQLDSPTQFNFVNVLGNLTIAPGVKLDIDLLGGASAPGQAQPLTVMKWGGTRSGTFTLSPELNNGRWFIQYDNANKLVQVFFVPEPTIAMLLVVGLTLLLRRRPRPDRQ